MIWMVVALLAALVNVVSAAVTFATERRTRRLCDRLVRYHQPEESTVETEIHG